jgi:hypothetical protein
MNDTKDKTKTADQILEENAAVKPIPFPYVHVGDQSRREFADNLAKAWLEGEYKIAGSLSHLPGEPVTKQIRALIERDAEKCMDDRWERENPPEFAEWPIDEGEPTRKITPEVRRSIWLLADQTLKDRELTPEALERLASQFSSLKQ